jgi:hypothetical protein
MIHAGSAGMRQHIASARLRWALQQAGDVNGLVHCNVMPLAGTEDINQSSVLPHMSRLSHMRLAGCLVWNYERR